MRYLKFVLVGLVGGLLLALAVSTVEFIHAQRVAASEMTNCATAGAYVCSGSAQFGGLEVPIAFALGFVATIIWFRRRRERRVA